MFVRNVADPLAGWLRRHLLVSTVFVALVAYLLFELLLWGVHSLAIWSLFLAGGIICLSRLHLSKGAWSYVGTQGGVAFIIALVTGDQPPDSSGNDRERSATSGKEERGTRNVERGTWNAARVVRNIARCYLFRSDARPAIARPDHRDR